MRIRNSTVVLWDAIVAADTHIFLLFFSSFFLVAAASSSRYILCRGMKYTPHCFTIAYANKKIDWRVKWKCPNRHENFRQTASVAKKVLIYILNV